jgi:hypothetical protein
MATWPGGITTCAGSTTSMAGAAALQPLDPAAGRNLTVDMPSEKSSQRKEAAVRLWMQHRRAWTNNLRIRRLESRSSRYYGQTIASLRSFRLKCAQLLIKRTRSSANCLLFALLDIWKNNGREYTFLVYASKCMCTYARTIITSNIPVRCNGNTSNRIFLLILGIAHTTYVNVVEKQIMLLTIKNK